MVFDASTPFAASCAACLSGETCVEVMRGADLCLQLFDGGTCPAGYTSPCKGATPGCEPPNVTEYYCFPTPAACGSTVTCECTTLLVGAACGVDEPCLGVTDGVIYCNGISG
jgi:hypothetical protein